MKLVVSGALGHIGSRLIRDLPKIVPVEEVVLIDNLSNQRYPSLFDLPNGVPYRFIEDDVTSMDLDPIVRGAAAVVHLAALTDAASSFERRDLVERNNFEGTKRVAEACARQGARLLFPSSTSVYGSQAERVDETCPEEDLKPQSPYAETKLREESLIASLVRQAGLRAAVCRFGTIFGTSPGMRFHTAVNRFCWQATLGQPLTVWRTAYDQKRPYLGLGDAVRAIGFLLRRDAFDGTVYNVVSENATVRQVIEAIKRHRPATEVVFVDSPIMNQLSYEVANTRLEALGFQPGETLTAGVGETLALLRGVATAQR